ncbi:Calx-beta domain-containing protein [Parvicella tangerina]|uniref:Pentraxin (PTX) domain-containing protein n=1 Tax=Parvicella tangerina TaxID=2829795 RepID=A0A916JLP5_9FLAO|nr:Calx-beta domain-containing protein [Parvicella tangerina]CAG5081352.1 hypothetical protein CRYO30217_01604 [Parvicella tangerina]
MKKHLLSYVFILTSAIYSAQTGPGGVGDATSNIFWLDASQIVGYADGDDLDTWNDVSGNGLDLTQPTPSLTPEYKTGIVNGYPVVRFNKTTGTYGRLRRTGVASFPSSAITEFVVNFNSGESNDALTSYASSGNSNDMLLFNSSNLSFYIDGGNTSSGVSSNDGNWHIISPNWRSSDGDTKIWLDGNEEYTATFQAGASITAGGCFAIAGEQDAIDGGYVAAQAHLGDFAEVLVFDFSLNDAQMVIVNNYLAAKYNIALSANDYYAYEATHSIDVAGIGRETATQTHTDAMSADILEVSNPSGLDADQEYLIFGHDNSDVSTAWTTTEAPNGGADIQRLAREWRFSEINGDVGTVDFDVDISTFPALPAGFTSYGIMVDSDGDFSSGATIYEVGLVAGSVYDVTGINIADGDYVAICAIDPQITFTTDKSDGFEPNNATLNIELNYIPRNDVTVDYTTADGSAAAAQPDYTAAAGATATILAGNTSGTFTISINDDAAVESDETFTITLSNPMAGVDLGAITVHTYTIHDDDNARKIYFDLDTDSGDESISPVTVNVSMSSTSATDVSIDYTVTGGTATEGASDDYVLASGTVTIVGGSGLTTGSFTFTVDDDAIYENDETVVISLSNPVGCNMDLPAPSNVGTGFTEYTYTIIDNDTPPEIQFSTASASGSESTSPASITVELSSTSQADASATYTVADVIAVNGSDYSMSSGTVTIPAGSSTIDLLATIIDDGIEEVAESFTITLSAPTDASLGTNTVFTYTINDNDVFGYQGPGGVGSSSNNVLWVSGDNGIYNDAGATLAGNGDAAQEWHDRSGNGNDLSQTNATFKPTYVTNAVNSLPAIRFNVANNRIRRTSFSDFPVNAITTISVMNTSQTGDGHVSYATTGDNNEYLLFDSGNQRTYVAGANVATGHSYADGTWHILGHTWRSSDGENLLYEDNSQVYSGTISTGNSFTTGGCLALGGEQDAVDGGYDAGQDYDGDIAETIMYNVKLNTAQRNIVNNYLAAKYGLTVANDLYAFEGTFGHEVAGIGREDVNNFHQDGQGSSIIRMNTASDLGDGEYMLWGHDNVALNDGTYTAPWTGTNPPGVDNSLHRVWRVDETGDLGTVTVMVDVSALTITSTGDLVLMIDSDDGDFVNASTIALSSYSAPYAVFTGVDFSDGDWFTLGSITPGNELPIELISFDAQPKEKVVDLYWETASEINNDYFTVERSKNGVEWKELARVEGAGNSSKQLLYNLTDYEPLSGNSYYRLKQTDFNGDFEYSHAVVVHFKGLENPIKVYPNPTKGIITVLGTDLSGDDIKVVNSLGQDVTYKTIVQTTSENQINIDLGSLSDGYYFVKTKSTITKVVKQ